MTVVRRIRVATLLLMLAFTGAARAEVVEFSVGDDSLRFAVTGPLSRFIDSAKGEYDVGGVWRERDAGDGLVVHAGALLTGDAGMRDADVQAGLGLRAAYIDFERDSGGAIALGGRISTRFPGFDRIGFGAYGYFAPEVSSFGRVDEYYEYGGEIDYQLLRDASVYVGYREIRAELNRYGKVKIDDSFHVGLRLRF